MNIRILTLLVVSLFLSACASTSTLNRELVHQQKIKTINLNTMPENISIQESDSTVTAAAAGGLVGVLIGSAIDGNINSKRKKALEPIIEMLDDLNVNMVFATALKHYLADGIAFSEDLVLDSNYDPKIKKPFLTPILTPNVTMLANYSGVGVDLTASIAQKTADDKQNKYTSYYRSEQLMDSESLTDREGNKQFWKDNSLLLREKIVDGLYAVADQFANDYNSNDKNSK